MKLANYDLIITIGADMENDSRHIPELVRKIADFDVVVAACTKLPQISERIASRLRRRKIGVEDVFSTSGSIEKQQSQALAS